MKFIISSSALQKQLSYLSGVLSSSNALPILDNFLFELNKKKLKISASDLETTMTIALEVESGDEGNIAIPGRLLLDTMKTFPDQPLTFTVDPKKCSIEILSNSGKYRLAGHSADDFPKPAELAKPSSIEMESKILGNAIDKTLFAISSDELRPVMCGMFVGMGADGITFVTTDAHKLVKYRRGDVKCKSETSFIIPKKPLSLLKSILGQSEITIEYNAVNVSFSLGNASVITKLIDGKYPNYDAVIPKNNDNKLTVDRMELLSSVRRVSVFSNRNTHQIRLNISGKLLKVMTEDLDNSSEANETIKCEYKGQPLEIAFNSRFLSEILSAIDSEEILIELDTPNRAGLIRPVIDEKKNKDEIVMLIMPVMINN